MRLVGSLSICVAVLCVSEVEEKMWFGNYRWQRAEGVGNDDRVTSHVLLNSLNLYSMMTEDSQHAHVSRSSYVNKSIFVRKGGCNFEVITDRASLDSSYII